MLRTIETHDASTRHLFAAWTAFSWVCLAALVFTLTGCYTVAIGPWSVEISRACPYSRAGHAGWLAAPLAAQVLWRHAFGAVLGAAWRAASRAGATGAQRATEQVGAQRRCGLN